MIGKGNIGGDQLAKIKLKPPDWAGRFWEVLPHKELADKILLFFAASKYRIERIELATFWSGQDFTAGWVLDGGGVWSRNPQGLRPALGVIHSNAGNHATTLYYGACTAEGQALVFGSLPLERRKGYKSPNLLKQLDVALPAMADGWRLVPPAVQALKSTPLSGGDLDQIVAECARNKVLAWGLMGKVDALYRSLPDEGKTAYNFLCIVSEHVLWQQTNQGFLKLDQLNDARKIVQDTILTQTVR